MRAAVLVAGEGVMVDRERRDRLAELLAGFAAGRITNDQWDAAVLPLTKADDPVLRTVWGTMWFAYSDLREHRLTGSHSLPDEWRSLVGRVILFLSSDLPYEWPVQPRWRRWDLLLALGTLGLVNRNPPPPHPLADPANREFWPFRREDDLRGVAATRAAVLSD